MVGPGFKSGREAVYAVSGVFDSHTSPPIIIYRHAVTTAFVLYVRHKELK